MDSYVSAQAAAILTVAAILVSACIRYLKGRIRSRRYRLPPGPKPWPVLGNLPLLAWNQHVPLEVKLAELARKYGPIVQLKLGSVPAVVISSPELAQVVLKEQDLVFATRPAPSFAARELTYIHEGTPFSPYGPSWRFTRKVLTLELLTHKRIEQYQSVREEELDVMVSAIRHKVVTQPLGGSVEIDLIHQFRTATFNTLTRIALGKRYICQPGESISGSGQIGSEGKDRDMYQEVVGDTTKLLGTTHMMADFVPMLWFLDWFRSREKKVIRDNFAAADAFFQKMVDEHRFNQEQQPGQPPRDVLDVLLNLRDSSGEPIKDSRIKALVKTTMNGGVDTSWLSLKRVVMELLREPKYLELAQQELDQVVGRHRKVEEADLPHLPLLRAIIKETWRLASGLLLPRCSTRDTKVAGYDIPANTTVLLNVHSICHDPAVWPDPHRFYPERFLERPEIDVKGNNFELLVFGSGRRMCPGLNLGTTVVEITLARLLHSFNLSLPAQPQDLTATWLDRLMAVPSLRLPSHLY